MIAPGTDLKFKLSVEMAGFSLDNDDFSLTIRNRYGQPRYVLGKEKFLHGNDGGWYFVMQNARKGSYFAELTCHIKDLDFLDGTQSVKDMQHLVDVGFCQCISTDCHCGKGHTDFLNVCYERVLGANFNRHEWAFGSPLPIRLS